MRVGLLGAQRGPLSWGDEPLWLWLTSQQATALLVMKRLQRPQTPEYAPR